MKLITVILFIPLWTKYSPRHHFELSEMFVIIIFSGVRLSPLGTAATIGLLYQPQMVDGGDYGAIFLMTLQPFVGSLPLFSFLIYSQSVGLLGRVISPSQGLYLHTEQRKHRINAYSHRCLEWDSNP
jgi:hypothetical protein